jgi:D-tyrosyl-tRNA(Tyr) deacylase
MIALLQRVSRASVEVERETVGAIGHGVLVFLGVTAADTEESCDKLAGKVADFRILEGPNGKPDKSLVETEGAAVLVVSQFTLAADTDKGRRADYGPAAKAAPAKALYERFVEQLRQRSLPVETGRFGADMKVHLINDGPVTFWLEVQ